LFEVAEKGIDAKATEEKLAKGREEVKVVSQRMKNCRAELEETYHERQSVQF
jgi:hypothetical protein